MSEPPPGAVLMMNSTGFVGATSATAPPPDAAAPAVFGAAEVPPPAPPPQAAATTRPAIASETDRPNRLPIRPSRMDTHGPSNKFAGQTSCPSGQTGGIVGPAVAAAQDAGS